MHRHTTIVTNETYVDLGVGSCRSSSDRADNAIGERVSDYSAFAHFRLSLYRGGGFMLPYASKYGYT